MANENICLWTRDLESFPHYQKDSFCFFKWFQPFWRWKRLYTNQMTLKPKKTLSKSQRVFTLATLLLLFPED